MRASFDAVQPAVQIVEDGEKVYIFIAMNGEWTERQYAENEPAVQVWECDYREIVTSKNKIDLEKVKAAPERFLEWVEPKEKSEVEMLKAQLAAATERSDFIEDCIAEMAMRVYAE